MQRYKFDFCKDCISNKEKWFDECQQCADGSKYMSSSDFDNGQIKWKLEEQKPKYFLIRWLIRAILKIESNYVNIWFCGISFRRKGKKHYNGREYPFLLRLFFPFVYVYETENGGISGDFYAGTIYYRIFPFVYLVFDYET